MSLKRMMMVGAGGLLLALVVLDPVFASTSGGGNLPWESPLRQIQIHHRSPRRLHRACGCGGCRRHADPRWRVQRFRAAPHVCRTRPR